MRFETFFSAFAKAGADSKTADARQRARRLRQAEKFRKRALKMLRGDDYESPVDFGKSGRVH